jgi:hypothetical protein
MITISDALYALGIDGGWKIKEGQIVKWWADKPQPSDDVIQAKLTELNAAEPMRLLREERNRRIALTDWRFRSDLSPSQEWRDYCVALRDLPANYSPTFDIMTEDGYPLVKEDNTTPWPEEPTDG